MIRRGLVGVLVVLLTSCGLLEVHEDPGPREPPIVLRQDDSAAIAAIKKSLGVWNGKVMDWVRNVADSQVVILEIQNPSGGDITIPAKGLGNMAKIIIDCGNDSAFNIRGLERLSSLSWFVVGGAPGVSLKYWPRGFFYSKSIQKITMDGQMKVVPDSLAFMSSLRVIDLGGGTFTNVPLVFFSMPNLDTVAFALNQICAPSESEKIWLNLHSPGWSWQNCGP